MQVQYSVQGSLFFLHATSLLLHKDFLHLHNVTSTSPLGAGFLVIKGVVNCQNSRDKGPPEGNSTRG